MKIEFIDPKLLKEYGRNNKQHPKDQIEKIKNQLTLFGFDQPIVVDESLTILKGHGRRLAAIELGLELVPVYIRTGLIEEQKKALRIGDNASSISDWNFQNLRDELNELDSINITLSAWSGFSPQELTQIMVPESNYESGRCEKCKRLLRKTPTHE